MENPGLVIAIIVLSLSLLLLSGLWLGLAIGAVGILLYILFIPGGWDLFGMLQFNSLNSFVWTAMPLFIFMGNVVFRCGLGDRLYNAAAPLVGILPGGLVHTNIVSCAIFAASTGSSVATAATIGSIAIPELQKRNYPKRLIFGTLAAGGTLGVMIPPSLGFIVYGALVGESIGKLFIAGIFPGLLLVFLFMGYIAFTSTFRSTRSPSREKLNLKAIFYGLKDLLPVGLLILFVLGSIYQGVATPTESASIGSVGALIIAKAYGKLNWQSFKDSVLETISAMGMIFLCVVGTQIMSMAIAYLQVPNIIAEYMVSGGMNQGAVFVLVVMLYLILGCFLDGISMILLTVPITFPVMMSLGFDPVWFGVIVVLLSEIGLVTPPVGMNLFIIQGVAGEDLSEVIYGTFPFIILMILGVALLYLFPDIATWLPSKMTKAF